MRPQMITAVKQNLKMLLAHSTMSQMLEKNSSYEVSCCLFFQSSFRTWHNLLSSFLIMEATVTAIRPMIFDLILTQITLLSCLL